MYRSFVTIGIVGGLAIMIGVSALLARQDANPRYAPVPALRFAGADLVYVVRRIAGEAGLVLALDELRSLTASEDPRLSQVDVDLPAGTVDSTLAALRDQVGGFDYSFPRGLLYVRSYKVVESKTALDRPNLPGGTFEGDLKGLGAWLQKKQPEAFLRVRPQRGHPVGPPVSLSVPRGSSALDVLLMYAEASGLGWRLRRSGEPVSESENEIVVVATELTPWKPLPSPHHVPSIRMEGSMVQAFADLGTRTKTPICVIDPGPLYGNRGTLERAAGIDPGFGVEPSLQDLSLQAGYVFRWEERDGVYVIWAEGFDRFPWLGDILKEELRAGEFRGTIFELSRWLTAHRTGSVERQIVGGEIVRGMPEATIQVEPGTTIGQVLFEFARATNRGYYLVIFDNLNPKKPYEGWRGAFLSDLAEWGELPTPW